MTRQNPYLNPARVRAALRSLNLRPTRGMGQNFLTDQRALNQMVAAAELTSADVVVEIGPGLGVLTWELLQRAGHVVAVELDKRLYARLVDDFAAELTSAHIGALHPVQGDVLSLPPAALFTQAGLPSPAPGSYKLVASLPYAITSPVLRLFLEQPLPPSLLVVLVQWEVAQRITAGPGDLSMLAHAIQIYAEPEIVARVPARSFSPEPAIDSAILRLNVRRDPALGDIEPSALLRLIKAGFLQPRKKLGNALVNGLKSLGERHERETLSAVLTTAGIDPQRRAETLTRAEWSAVYRAMRAVTE